ncbi:MAG: NUDIX domain-containing protein [Anaerolineales bacterium]|nr:NUDIX domain-containing protein [Anaerolineales bacterium]
MTKTDKSHEDYPPKHVICVGAVVIKGKQVLLVRQASGHTLEGQWSIPWGYVDSGEFPDEAACRETLEESNIEAQNLGLIGIQELHDRGWIAVVFLCKHIRGTPRADDCEETDQARFFTLEEIRGFDEQIEPWCDWIIRKVLVGDYTIIPNEPDNPYHPLKSFL